MFSKMMNKINKYFNEPINESLRKSPEMVKAHTEAEILKAEEDFKILRPRSFKNSRGSIRLVPRYPDEDQFLAHAHAHTAHGPVWDIQPSNVKTSVTKKLKRKKAVKA